MRDLCPCFSGGAQGLAEGILGSRGRRRSACTDLGALRRQVYGGVADTMKNECGLAD